MTRYAVPRQGHCLCACDRAVTGGILFLILFTPLAFGAVHPWAFSLMEAVVFLLVILWMGKLLFSSDSYTLLPPRSFVLPLALFMSFVSFQLLPLPPSLLRLVSPATYELYSRSLPGWPEKMPYDEPSFQSSPLGSEPRTPDSGLQTPDSAAPWRSLSIAPALTRTSFLKLCAYSSLLLLVLLYPFDRTGEAEERFFRSVLLTVLFTGVVVAGIGIVQQLTWNGKILWFFVPYDWDRPHPEALPRASGPFINPDHFANYLMLIFPLALVGTFFRTFLIAKGQEKAFRLFCGFAVFLLLTGILLSLSRSGWIGTALGTGILLGVFFSLPKGYRSALLPRSEKSLVRCAGVGLLLFILALFFVGPAGRSQVDIRLEETVTRDVGLWGRVPIWKDSIGMIRDFPFLGVGLGSWSELFPRYASPPWSPLYFSEAHNDYLELGAETGLIGLGLLIWFGWQGGRRLVRGLKMRSLEGLPLFAALLAALGVMGFHEFFDFNLQIPANAVLCTVLLGVALRLLGVGIPDQEPEVSTSSVHWSLIPGLRISPRVLSIGTVALLLLILALRQERLPYPYNLKEPTSLAEARELFLSHPARASSHFSLFSLLQESTASSDLLLQELEIALWLDPRDPEVRDAHATALLQHGREEEGLQEMMQSVFWAPSLSDHSSLDHRRIPELSEQQQSAVEEGLKRALARGYEGALRGLGAFYDAVGRVADEAGLYEEAAQKETEVAAQLQYLLNAGLAYTRAEDEEKAEALFRQAMTAAPQDLRAYQYLATQVFAPRGELKLAKAVISEGIKSGADPFFLSLLLAEAAQIVRDNEEVKTALLQALALRPSSFDTHLRLGLLYLQERNFDRAVLSLRRALDINPSSASAFYHLGTAEEGRYQFFAAEKAYARAAELAPDNPDFQQHYAAFLQRVAEDGKNEPKRNGSASLTSR